MSQGYDALKRGDAAAARKFYEEHQKLLKLQEQVVKEEFGAIVGAL